MWDLCGICFFCGICFSISGIFVKGRLVFFIKMVNCLVIMVIICVLVIIVGIIVFFVILNWLSVRVLVGVMNKRVDVCDCFFIDCDCGLWFNC